MILRKLGECIPKGKGKFVSFNYKSLVGWVHRVTGFGKNYLCDGRKFGY